MTCSWVDTFPAFQIVFNSVFLLFSRSIRTRRRTRRNSWPKTRAWPFFKSTTGECGNAFFSFSSSSLPVRFFTTLHENSLGKKKTKQRNLLGNPVRACTTAKASFKNRETKKKKMDKMMIITTRSMAIGRSGRRRDCVVPPSVNGHVIGRDASLMRTLAFRRFSARCVSRCLISFRKGK